MSNANIPTLRQGQRDDLQGFSPLVDANDEGTMEMKDEKKMLEAQKWCITAVICILTIDSTFASSAPAIATPRLIEQFGISDEVSELVTVLFLLGYVVGPIFWGSGSEMFGRRNVSLLSMAFYTILFLGQALAKNIATVFFFRFLSGIFAVAPLIVSGGILADIWNAQGRGYATSLFGGCVFLGPALGPLVGGFIASDQSLGWEWIFWVMMFFGGFCTVLIALFLPETYGPVLLTRKARRLRKQDPIRNANVVSDHEKLDSSFHGLVDRTLYRPWKMLASEPILILLTIYMSVVYGILYALFEAFPVIFIEHKGLTLKQLGLLFIGIGIGSILTTIMNLFFAWRVNKVIPKWKGFPPAEMRLYGGMIGAFVLVGSVLWLGWTGNNPTIAWFHPGTSTIFVGFAISAIFTSMIVYIVDTYLMFAATALATNTIIRSAVGSIFPLFTTQLYHHLGIGWASTFIAAVCLVLMPIPFLFFKYGARIRSKSKFAPCLDLKIAKQIQEQEAKDAEAQLQADKTFTVQGPFILDPMPGAREVNATLVENIQQLTNTISEVDYLLHEAVSSQEASSQSKRELVDSIREYRMGNVHTRRETIYGIGQQPISAIAERPPLPPTSYEWSVQMGPIDLSAVSDIHDTALSFARMTRLGSEISPPTQAEARAFYEAWSENPPSDYATLSVIPNF
ncbi:MFS general substrate transporter [Gymnopus androsaceus JB14]|uniref:MFS general substrate transporter n=1 Tax=Gymnopus androsaceus JB14 TaxID=1447944 RepID=A0A6A4I7Y5_9AGAR|nr:MFS general substrate transporter [Gymnopus androsaceus JB14]